MSAQDGASSAKGASAASKNTANTLNDTIVDAMDSMDIEQNSAAGDTGTLEVPRVQGQRDGEEGLRHLPELEGEIVEYRRADRCNKKRHNICDKPGSSKTTKGETLDEVSKLQATGSLACRPSTTGFTNLASCTDHRNIRSRFSYAFENENDNVMRDDCNSSVGSSSSSSRRAPAFTDKAQSLGLLKTLNDFLGDNDELKLNDYVTSFLMRFPRSLWGDSELVWLFSEKLKGKAREYFKQLPPAEKGTFDGMIEALKRQLKGENAMNQVQASMKFNSLKFDMGSQTFSKFIHTFESLAEQANPELPLVVRKKTMGNRLYDILISSGWKNMEHMTKIVMDGEGSEYDRMKEMALNFELMQEASKITKRVMNERPSTTVRSVPRSSSSSIPKDQCGYCGKLGHWKRDCRVRLREQGDHRSIPASSNNARFPNSNQVGGTRFNGGSGHVSFQGGVRSTPGNFNNRYQPQYTVTQSAPSLNATGGNAQPLGQAVRFKQWSNRTVRIDDTTVGTPSSSNTDNPELLQNFHGGEVTGSSPLIEVDILGVRTLALVDSGAQVSTIAKGFLDDLTKKGFDVTRNVSDISGPDRGEILDASGNAIHHEGLKRIKIRVCASGIESEVVFYVVNYAPEGEPVLLGTNVLDMLGVELILRNDKGERVLIETKDKQIGDYVGVSKPSDLHKVKVFSRVLVRPNQIQPLVLKVEGASTREIQMWSQNENRVASGLTKVDSEGNTTVLVHNNTTEPVIFKEDEEIGDWEDNELGDRWKRGADDDSLDMLDLVVEREELVGKQRVDKLKSVIGCEVMNYAVSQLIEKYENIFALYDSELTSTHVVEHNIDTGGAVPLKQKARPVPVGARTQFKELMKGLLDRGIVEKSYSPWASPIVLVVKKDGTLRLCIDYRELNKRIKLDSFPLPRIDEMIQTLNGKKVFSSLDLHSGFWQIKLAKEAREITAFTTTEGLYQFKVLPFGLATSPAVFQRLMAGVLEGLNLGENEVQVYIDDILIATDTIERHLVVLKEVFEALSRAGLCLKPSKCELLKDKVKYLGHILTGRGVEADPEKVKAVDSFPVPKDVSQLRSFLGLCGYYRKFVLGFSKIAKPLTELTSKSVAFGWDTEQNEAFRKLKQTMCSAPVLAQPDFPKAQSGENPFVLFTDACKEGVGAVLCQKGHDGFLHPLYFISKGLTKAEKRYTITDLEGLAVVHAVQRLQSFLYNMHFIVKTDHQPLTAFFKSGKNDRVLRWALALQAYGQKMKIEYVPGKENVVADALSRCRREVESVQVTCVGEPENLRVGNLKIRQLSADSEWLVELRNDDNYKDIIQSVEAGKEGLCKLSGMQKKLRMEDFTISEGFLWFTDGQGSCKKVVPRSMREKLYNEVHGGVFAGHFSSKKVCEVLKKSYFWEGLPGDIAKWHQKCTRCYLVNVKGVNTPPLKPILMGKPFELVGVDLLDLGLTESGNKYALVLVDSFSKWMAAYPIRSKLADEVAETIVAKWICDGARWPQKFLSDMGTEFMNKVIEQVRKVMGIDWVTTKGYNPRENGLVERANGTILRALKKKMVPGVEWDKILPFVVYSCNTTPHSSTGESPYFLLHGIDPPAVVSCDVPELSKYIADVEDYRTVLVEGVRIAREVAREYVGKEMSRVKEYYDKANHVDKKWKPRVGDRVYVRKPENQLRNKLDIGYSGPMRVVDVSENSASVVDLNGRNEPVKLPFDWVIKVPSELSDEQVDEVVVRGRRGRPKMPRINRIIFSRPYVVSDWTPKMTLDYVCQGERIIHMKIRRSATKCCDMFSKSLGDMFVPDIPPVVSNVIVSSLGHLCNIMALTREYKEDKINEAMLVRECDTTMEFRELLLEDVTKAFGAAASRCVHVDLLLKENGLNPVSIEASVDWEVSENTIREAMEIALLERNASLRGPALQKMFIPRSVARLWPTGLTEHEIVYGSYADIKTVLEACGSKSVESVILIGDGTIGRLSEALPQNVFAGSKFAVALPQYGTLLETSIDRARNEYEEFEERLRHTPAKVHFTIPSSTRIPYFCVNGEEPIREGFQTIDRFKMGQYTRALKSELKETVGIDWKAPTMAGVSFAPDSHGIQLDGRRGMLNGPRAGRGSRGGHRGGHRGSLYNRGHRGSNSHFPHRTLGGRVE